MAAALLAACGPGASAPAVTFLPGPGSVRRVALEALEQIELDAAARPVADLPALADADWRRDDGAVGEAALELARGAVTRARVELGALDRAPTRVLLAVRAPTPLRAAATFGRGRAVVGRGEALVEALPDVTFTTLDVPAPAYRDRPPEWVEIEFERLALGPERPLPVVVVGARLVAVEPRALLPAPGAAALAGPDTLARRSQVVAPGEVLAGVFTPRAGERLRILAATDPEHRHPDARATLEATLTAPDGERRRDRVVVDAAGRWTPLELPLDHWIGQELELELELSEPRGRPLLAHVAEPLLVTRGDAPPTVLLITSDTHRADHLGAAGRGVEVHTPTLDALGRRGLRFTDVRSSANSTNPSHAALMTGTSPADTGIVDNDTALAPTAPTLAERFADAGYLTVAATSAVHLGPRWSGLGQGFDAYSSPTVPERGAAATAAALEALLSDHAGLPLFVWLHLFDAHAPYEPPSPFLAPHWPSGRDPFDPAAEGAAPWLAPPWEPRIADPRYTEALYRGEVDQLDARLGELFERVPRLTSGWVAFTSDHGEGLARDPVPFDHHGLSPATLEVPLLLAGPGLEPRAVDRPARQTDVGRTLLSLAGVADGTFPGQDLTTDATARDRFALEANRWTASVERDGWLLSLTLRAPVPGQDHGARHSVRLYHAAEDPHLEDDRTRAEPDRTRVLRAALVDWLAAHPPRPWTGEGVEGVAAQLALLGYTEGDAAPERGAVWIDPDCACEQCAAWRR